MGFRNTTRHMTNPHRPHRRTTGDAAPCASPYARTTYVASDDDSTLPATTHNLTAKQLLAWATHARMRHVARGDTGDVVDDAGWTCASVTSGGSASERYGRGDRSNRQTGIRTHRP